MENLKQAIEKQREKMDRMASRALDLGELMKEAEVMDHLIEQYEEKKAAV